MPESQEVNGHLRTQRTAADGRERNFVSVYVFDVQPVLGRHETKGQGTGTLGVTDAEGTAGFVHRTRTRKAKGVLLCKIAS